MLAILILGFCYMASKYVAPVVLDVRYSEQLGPDSESMELDLPMGDDVELEDPSLQPNTLPIVDDPLSSPTAAPNDPTGRFAMSSDIATTIGQALTGREPGMREALTKAYGGTALTEDTVVSALRWLARNQRSNGSWSLRGPYSDGSPTENSEAATAMALLAFQGHGHTHQKRRDDPFSDVVAHGWSWLRAKQTESGQFFGEVPYSHQLYTQAQCTIAICELYGMSGDAEFRAPAQLAIDYACKIQTDKGGWRYYPGRDEDLSVTGWFAMALQSARMAGLEVPSETFDRLSKYLDTVQKDYGAQYSYRPSEGARPSMTAEGLLCRQYLGWERDDDRLQRGVELLSANLVDWNGERNVYYWYYSTQVMHHMEGEPWVKWNRVMRQQVPENQVKSGREQGSWNSVGDRHGGEGGRLYVTCLCTYMLEVYYRHLPIYRNGTLGTW